MTTSDETPGAKWRATSSVKNDLQDKATEKPFTNEILSGTATDEELGKDLASIFKDNGVHPVLIFGSRGSGKTSLITSLFRYMRENEYADASIELADDIFPSDDNRWSSAIDFAQEIFYKRVFDFIDNTAPTKTYVSEPFFIPVRVSTKSGEEVLIAFLEGQGEWYQAEEDLSKKPYKKFKGLLQSLLINYNDPVTVVYVAPFVDGSSADSDDASHIRKSDIGLLGVINEYLAHRKVYLHQDKHLFLITKWDAYCTSIAAESFIDPTDEDIDEVLRGKYRLSWQKYNTLTLSDESQNKSVSTYSAGFMEGRSVASPAKEDQELVNIYPRKLWDWLYENSTGKILYPDVRPKKKNILEKIIDFLRGNG